MNKTINLSTKLFNNNKIFLICQYLLKFFILKNIINGLSFFSENKKQTLSNKHNLLINH